MFTNSDEVLRYIKDEDVAFVDVRFCDLPGVMQHFTSRPAASVADTFTEGLAFDGSLDPGLPGDPRVGHAAAAGPEHGGRRPVPQARRPSTSTSSSTTR